MGESVTACAALLLTPPSAAACAASWIDEAMLERDAEGEVVTDTVTGKARTRAVDMAASDQARGKLVAKGDAKHFCFTPMLRFANRVDNQKWDSEFFQIDAVQQSADAPWVAVVMWRIIGQGELQCKFNLERFPYDEQTLVIKLLSGACM